eukprot:6176107-Pleurochrysis_carterae.AAC.2
MNLAALAATSFKPIAALLNISTRLWCSRVVWVTAHTITGALLSFFALRVAARERSASFEALYQKEKDELSHASRFNTRGVQIQG